VTAIESYDELLHDVSSAVVRRAADPTPALVRETLEELRAVVPTEVEVKLQVDVSDQLFGYGQLTQLIQPGVTDVLVSGPASVWVDDSDGLRLSAVQFSSPAAVRQLAVRLAHLAGRRLDDAQPWVDAQLPDGVRLHAVLAPTAAGGCAVSLRFPAPEPLPLTAWLDLTGKKVSAYERLVEVISLQQSFLITGATGCGKTTLLRSMVGAMPSDCRIVTIEEVAELNVSLSNVVSLQGRQANADGVGEITMSDLVRQSLRMRPDRIMVGEVRGIEVLDWLLAVSSGHRGSASTVHALSATHALDRVQLLSSLALPNPDIAKRIVESSVDVVIHCERTAAGRAIVEIASVEELVSRR